ncbi:ATP-binding protein [Cystobacter fuscus]|uniref:ATP-binding protein n=1 Tax=Cystobacter fuscus TaxID=43 RepID=UPI0012DFC15E|nr:ATP-binding protein [Cystobacter fuscus]
MTDIYREWGFTENPFQTTALLPNDRGSRLLVGRENELLKLRKLLRHGPKLVTLEGANGVGKTSLVNVAAYRALSEHIATGEGPLLVPCGKMFQLRPDQDSDSFVDGVLLEVAQTLLDQAKIIKNSGRSLPSTKALDRWMNSPQLHSWQGSIGSAVASIGAGKTSETNTSEGFSRSGLRKEVLGWLNSVFPAEAGGGGVVCTIDNLELLQTSKHARQSLEQLRDAILLVPPLSRSCGGCYHSGQVGKRRPTRVEVGPRR